MIGAYTVRLKNGRPRARGGERESHGARGATPDTHVVDGARRRRGCDNRAALAKDEQRAL